VLKAKIRHIKTNDVFYNRLGNRIIVSNLLKAFYSVTIKANLQYFRWYDLRHTFATRLVQRGVDFYTLQKLGRWKTTQMVTGHARLYPESLRPGVEVLDRVRERFSTHLAQPNEKGTNPAG
jgi:integrase